MEKRIQIVNTSLYVRNVAVYSPKYVVKNEVVSYSVVMIDVENLWAVMSLIVRLK